MVGHQQQAVRPLNQIHKAVLGAPVQHHPFQAHLLLTQVAAVAVRDCEVALPPGIKHRAAQVAAEMEAVIILQHLMPQVVQPTQAAVVVQEDIMLTFKEQVAPAAPAS